MIEFYKQHSIAIKMWGVITGLLILGLFIVYITSSSESDTGKADKYAQQSANSNAESVVHETNANAISEQAEAVAEDREDAKQEYAKAKKKIKKGKYEEIRNKPVVVTFNDLDARERKLLARLRKQQG